MFVKIKKLSPDAIIPTYAKEGDAGMDLTALTVENDVNGFYTEYGTGLAMEIPEGHAGFIFPRSSASKTSQIQANCVGVIDSGYRGEIKVRLKNLGNPQKLYVAGDRVAQIIIMPVPEVKFFQTDQLSETVRGDGGFGSTGN
jgi:dUTP pyrophosphatase